MTDGLDNFQGIHSLQFSMFQKETLVGNDSNCFIQKVLKTWRGQLIFHIITSEILKTLFLVGLSRVSIAKKMHSTVWNKIMTIASTTKP